MNAKDQPKGPDRRTLIAGALHNLGSKLGAVKLARVTGVMTASGLSLPTANALGLSSKFRIGRLVLPGLSDPRPNAWRRLYWELERRTSLSTGTDIPDVSLGHKALFEHPMVYLTGDTGFPLPPAAHIARLRRYLTFGGFLLIDSAEGRAGGDFDASVRKLLAAVFPGTILSRVGRSHVVWRSFYLVREPFGRFSAAPYLEGIERDQRMPVLYAQNDLGGAMARDGFGRWQYEVLPGGRTPTRIRYSLRRQRCDVRPVP